jgi:site-specific DNA-methyltransferase (adenine-specific)
LVRKPISERNITLNVLKWGTGGLNIDGCRIDFEKKWIECHSKNSIIDHKKPHVASSYSLPYPESSRFYHQKGRYPSNVILDEKSADMLDKQVNNARSIKSENDDHGSVSRFFYCGKVRPSERGKLNRHPTVKPIKLVEYLVKLITPPNGIVFDPFVGSGTTLKACQNLGFNGFGFELDKSNEPIIRKRCHLDSNLAKYLGKN